MELNTFKRREIKYILNERQYECLLTTAKSYMTPDLYCSNNNKYSIYNIYYDTANNEIIHNSLVSSCFKEKLRLRGYKPFSSPNDIVFLEIKKKINGIVSKRRATLKLWEAKLFIDTGKKPSMKSYMDLQVINEIEFFLQSNNVQPAVLISYDRYAFFGKDNTDFRLTIDCNIQARRIKTFNDFCKPIVSDGQYIMELKIADSIPLWLSSAMSELGIYSSSFSKYGVEYKDYLLNKNVS